MKNLYILACSLFLFAFSCEKVPVNCSGELTLISSETLGAGGSDPSCSIQNIQGGETGSKVDLIIRSQADYEKYVLCTNSLPAIDFSQKTLLAGRTIAPYTDLIESQRVYKLCDGKVTFEVKLNRGGYAAVTDVYYFAIIPKISDDTNVNFTVGYN